MTVYAELPDGSVIDASTITPALSFVSWHYTNGHRYRVWAEGEPIVVTRILCECGAEYIAPVTPPS